MKRVLKRNPEQIARGETISELLQATNVNSMEDIQKPFRGTIVHFMENGLQRRPKDWQWRPLESIYAVLFLDAIK